MSVKFNQEELDDDIEEELQKNPKKSNAIYNIKY